MSLRLLLKLRKTHAGRVKIMLYIKSGSTEYACAICHCTEYYTLRGRSRVLVCKDCGHQESVTANTEFEGAKLPLTVIVDALIVYSSGIKISASALARFLRMLPSTMLRLLEKIRRATARCVLARIEDQNLQISSEELKPEKNTVMVASDLQIVPIELFDSVTGVRSIDSEPLQFTIKTEAESAIRKASAEEWFENRDPRCRKPIITFITDVKQIYHGISKRHAPGYGAESCLRNSCAGSTDDLLRALGRKRRRRSERIFGGDFLILPAFSKGSLI